jgi:RNA polymerase sigma-70 factor (ECF subfamily)
MASQADTGKNDRFRGELVGLQESLFYYALQLTENRNDALDLVQETNYKALHNKRGLHDNEHIRAWLYTILRNTYINYLRSSHHKQLVVHSDELNNYLERKEGFAGNIPDEALIRKELREIIDLLPLNYEKPIRMLLEGYSYKEIAGEMNIPIGTVKSRIHIGKKRIRKVYQA